MTTAIVQGIINRYLQKWLKNVTTEHAALMSGMIRRLSKKCLHQKPRPLAVSPLFRY